MKRTIIIPFCTVLFMLMNNELYAQNQIMDFMHSMGKIYVVTATVIAIFLGIVWFLFRLDRKLTKLENQINNERKTS